MTSDIAFLSSAVAPTVKNKRRKTAKGGKTKRSTKFQPPLVFINYRHKKSLDIAGRLRDRLLGVFGGDRVIRDTESFPFGDDFDQTIKTMLPKCTTLLTLIDDDWLKEIKRRAKAKTFDWVVFELELALNLGVRIVPVLVNGSAMPDARSLPRGLKALATKTAVPLRSGIDFHNDFDSIIAVLAQACAQRVTATRSKRK